MKYSRVINWVLNTPWAITPTKLAVIMDLLAFYADGNRLTAEEVQDAIGAVNRGGARTTGAIQVLPLYGVIAQRAGMMTETSGGTSTEAFKRQFDSAVADAQIDAILIDVDSPGGAVSGVDELSAAIHAARGAKPIVAVANSLAASAAYWIATAADSLYITPTGETGSIGVIAAHEDDSALYEREGVKTTLITAGKYKGEGNPYEPLSEDARTYLQSRVDEYYAMFVSRVAKNRGVAVSDVRGGFGEGRVVGAKAAKAMGMVDGIKTMEEVIESLQRDVRQKARSRAEIDYRQRRARAYSR
jgi:signal peptide peptidase SppA